MIHCLFKEMEIEKQKFDELLSNQSKAVEQARSEVRSILLVSLWDPQRTFQGPPTSYSISVDIIEKFLLITYRFLPSMRELSVGLLNSQYFQILILHQIFADLNLNVLYSTVIKKSSPYDVLSQLKLFICSHFQF